MKLRLSEVVLIQMQFLRAQGSKVRPAMVLLDSGDDDFVAAPITSQPKADEFDLKITNWSAAGLNVPSTARVHKLTVLSKSEIVRRLGFCGDSDRALLTELMCRMFCRSKQNP
jgi:mRNA interferase MazF